MKTITILLSAYNGAACLPDQLDSLLAQIHPATRILVRDDGSTDGTLEVLADYARRCGCLTCYSGENLGASRSFFDLLARAAGPGEPPTDDYALCDQDDRWLPNRIEAGISMLERVSEPDASRGENEPMLACGRPQLVDAAFRPLRETRRFVLPQPSFGNALVENICIGCTATFNRALLLAAVGGGLPEHAVMHDWWLYLTAAGLGKVFFDPEPAVLYRQHGGNAVGMAATTAAHQLGRAKRFVKARGHSLLRGQTAEFLRLAGPRISSEKASLAERFVDGQDRIGNRISLACDRRIRRQRREDDILFRMMLVLGHYR